MSFQLQTAVRGTWEQAKGVISSNFKKLQSRLDQLPGTPTFIPPRELAIDTSATPVLDVSQYDVLHIHKQQSNIATITIVGDPTEAQEILFSIQDDGTPRTIAWGPMFDATGSAIPLPSTTVPGQRLFVKFVFHVFDNDWDCILATAAPVTVTPSALTANNDTNVTLTLGGTPATALLKAVSLTLGWTGLLGLARGGTNADLSATGGAHQVLKQVSTGAAITVGQLTGADISSGFLTQSFRNLQLRTHPDADKAANQVALLNLDEVVMNDGARYSGLTLPLTADITTSGAGGLDTGSRNASTWYRILLIGKSSTFATSDLMVMFHRAKNYTADQSNTTTNNNQDISSSSSNQKVASQFTAGLSGLLEFIDIKLIKFASPTGNIRFQLQTDNSGAPSGTVLATSDAIDVSQVSTTAQVIRFVFRSPATVTASTVYWLVAVPSYATSGTNFIAWAVNTAGSTTVSLWNGTTWASQASEQAYYITYVTQNSTADNSSMPSGYDEYCHIGWVYNNGSNVLDRIQFRNRKAIPLTVDGNTLSTTNTVATLAIASIQIPPAPLYVELTLANNTGGDGATVAGVPDGYGEDTLRTSGGARVYPSSVSNGTSPPVFIATEFQAIYGRAESGGTATFFITGFEW